MKSYSQLRKEYASLKGEIKREMDYLPLEKLEVKIKKLHELKDELKAIDEREGITYSSGDHSYKRIVGDYKTEK